MEVISETSVTQLGFNTLGETLLPAMVLKGHLHTGFGKHLCSLRNISCLHPWVGRGHHLFLQSNNRFERNKSVMNIKMKKQNLNDFKSVIQCDHVKFLHLKFLGFIVK